MPRILLVEDDLALREATAELLTWAGYTVETAEHGADALVWLRHTRPGVIVTDLQMPVMDGVALLRACASDPALADIPIVVTSGTPMDLTTSAAPPPFAVLRKPDHIDQLLPTLARALDAPRAVTALQ